MKIEKLRNNHKKEIIIGTILTIVIGGALTFKLTHSKYRTTQSIDLAEGVINYKVPDFKIMAMYQQKDGSTCTNDDCYNEITTMPSSGYVINESKSYCNLNGSKDNNVVIENVNGKPLFSGLNKGDKCYLYFDKYVPTASETILANLGTSIKTGTPDFSKTATTDEGVYSTTDGMYSGTTYYWRGKVENNYVKFAGFCWRIIRINGDKTIRMIYDGSSCHANGANTAENIAVTGQAYNPTYNASYYVGWTQNGSQRTLAGTASNAKTQIESWYSSNITGTNATKVADGKYCNDRDTGQPYSSWSGFVTTWSANGTQFAYAGVDRLWNKYQPTFSCPSGDVYTLKVGLITADEVEFAGGKNENNTSYYLYNGQSYWTMSPYYWPGYGFANVFRVNSNGDLNDCNVDNTIGLRPVINLKANTTFATGGTGTQSNPYVVQ